MSRTKIMQLMRVHVLEEPFWKVGSQGRVSFKGSFCLDLLQIGSLFLDHGPPPPPTRGGDPSSNLKSNMSVRRGNI
jgi:hypothetical protein